MSIKISEWKKAFWELVKLPRISDIDNGLIHEITYKNTDKEPHRLPELGPAVIRYYESGNIWYIGYHLNIDRHRPHELGPASIEYFENGEIMSEFYWFNNELHRPCEDGPAVIVRSEGFLLEKEYYVHGKKHNEYGPAKIYYYNNGNIFRLFYMINNKLHRPIEEGPAFIEYDRDGNIVDEQFWVDGVPI